MSRLSRLEGKSLGFGGENLTCWLGVRHCSEMVGQLDSKLTERDFVLMWNLMPSGYEEAKHLVPGLNNVPQEHVVKMVNFLNEKRGLTQMAANANH